VQIIGYDLPARIEMNDGHDPEMLFCGHRFGLQKQKN
jgi:hypothetical protein